MSKERKFNSTENSTWSEEFKKAPLPISVFAINAIIALAGIKYVADGIQQGDSDKFYIGMTLAYTGIMSAMLGELAYKLNKAHRIADRQLALERQKEFARKKGKI